MSRGSSLDHGFIDEHGLVSRYVAGHLPEDDAREFEAHFVECPVCLEQLELEQRLRAGLVDLQGRWRSPAPSQAHAGGILIRLSTLAAAAAVVIAAGATFEYVQVRRQLTATESRVATLERERTASPAVAAPPQPVDITPPRTTALPEPRGHVAVVELDATRSLSGRGAPTTTVNVSSSTSLLVLNLAVGDVTDFSRFSATLQTSSGVAILRQDDLQPASPTSVGVALDAAMLLPGDYTIVLDGAIRNRAPITVGRYRFRLARR